MLFAGVPADTQWRTKEQIAQHFQCSARTISNLMCRKILPHSKTGNLVRFDLGECDHAFQQFAVGVRRSSDLPAKVDQHPRTWRTKSQIAEHLQVSLRTVSNLMRRRVVPYVKIGHIIRLDLPQADAAFKQLRSRCLFDGRAEP